jgi:hypothetical protein
MPNPDYSQYGQAMKEMTNTVADKLLQKGAGLAERNARGTVMITKEPDVPLTTIPDNFDPKAPKHTFDHKGV